MRRRQAKNLIVDRKLQLPVAVGLVGVFCGVGLLFAVAFTTLIDDQAYVGLTGPEVRSLVLKLNAAYFSVTAAACIVFLTRMTHRVAGPARVIERALRGMVVRDYTNRTRVRNRDYLRYVADAAEQLQSALEERDAETARLLAALDAALADGDAAAAREIVRERLGAEAREPCEEEPLGV